MAEKNMAVSLVETVRRHAAGLLNLGDLPNCVGLPGEFIDAIPNGARGKLFARTGGAFADLISRGEVDTEFVIGLFSVAQQKNLLTEADFDAAMSIDVIASLPYEAVFDWIRSNNWMVREGDKEDAFRLALVELVLLIDQENEIRDSLFEHVAPSFLNRVDQSDLAAMLVGQRNARKMPSVDELLWTTFGLERIVKESDPGAVAKFLMDELGAWDPSGDRVNAPEEDGGSSSEEV